MTLAAFETARGHMMVGAAVCGAALVVILFAVPRSWLPILAVTISLTVPATELELPHIVQGAVLPTIPLTIWLLRCGTTSNRWGPFRALGLLVAVWLMLSEVFAPIRTKPGMGWFACALIVIAGIAIVAPDGIDATRFRRYYLRLTTALACFALVEVVLQKNPIYGQFYAAHGSWTQDWHSYRATTLMGHPIVNATIFASAVVLMASEILGGRTRMSLGLLRFAVLVGGLAATQSRGGAIAVVPGLVLVLLLQRSERGAGTRRLALIVLGLLAIGALGTSLAGRNESAEGRGSAAVRSTILSRAKESLVGTTILGAGPGQAQAYRVARQLPDTDIPLENSYAQLLVSLGLVGAVLFTMLLLSAVVRGLRPGGGVGEASAMLTILVAVAGYNAIEDHPALLVVIGLFMTSMLAAERGYAPAALASNERAFGASPARTLQVAHHD